MISTWSYARVSHRYSVEGFSLPAQDAAAIEYHDALELPPWGDQRTPEQRWGHFTDLAVSAYKVPFNDREQGRRLMGTVNDGDHVLFYSMCRGFRRVADWCHTCDVWLKRGITAHFIRDGVRVDSAAGWFTATLFSLYCQWKAMMIKERQKIAAAIRKAGLPRVGETKAPVARITAMPIDQRIAAILAERAAAPVSIELPGRVFSYVRCSDIEQVATGTSAEAQRRTNELYAHLIGKRHGCLPGVTLLQDLEVSAYTVPMDKRPAGSVLLASLRKGDHVVVSRVDRAFRSIPDMVLQEQKIRAKGAFLHFADTGHSTATAQGRMLIAVLAALAEFESAQTSEMTKDGNAARRASGIIDHPPPYLRREVVDGHQLLFVDELRVSQLREIKPVVEAGKTPKRRIEDALEEIDAGRWGDKRIPLSGFANNSLAARRLNPMHGQRTERGRYRWWKFNEVEAMHEPGYFDKMERVILEIGV